MMSQIVYILQVSVVFEFLGSFYQPERAQRADGWLRLLYVFRVCLFVCLYCASALITCAIYYVIRYYAIIVLY